MAVIQIFDATDAERQAFQVIEADHDVTYQNESVSVDSLNKEAEIVSVFVSSTIDSKVIDALPKLKLIACRSTGFNNVDIEAAKKRGIPVVTVPTYGEHTVAEFTLGLMIALLRKIITDAEQMLANSDEKKHVHGTDLQGKTLGIVGLGRIGRNVATLAQAFGMSVIAYDPFAEGPPKGVSMIDLEKLCKQADVVSLHAPLTSDNKHLVSTELIDTMRDGVYIINTARGELIDTAALVAALKNGKVAGAALDVLEDENLTDFHEEQLLLKRGHLTRELMEHAIANSILMRMPNVILTNHNAYNTVEAIGRINQTTLNNIKHYLVGNVANEVSA